MQTIKKLPTEHKLHKSKNILHHHERMGHLSFKILQLMAKKGIFSKGFVGQNDPKCQACMMAKATRRRWRSKGSSKDNNTDHFTKLKPGQVISVAQLTTETPGYVAQMTGIPTKRRYTVATVSQYGLWQRGLVGTCRSRAATAYIYCTLLYYTLYYTTLHYTIQADIVKCGD